jgi:hypothetical protein
MQQSIGPQEMETTMPAGSSDTVTPEPRPRSFRLFRQRGADESSSKLTHGRMAFWIATIGFPSLYLGQLAVAWPSSVIAVLLGINELVFRRKVTRNRHPGLAVVGILFGLFVLASIMLIWRCQHWMRRANDRYPTFIQQSEPAIDIPGTHAGVSHVRR